MSLIRCPECSHEISDQASACPQCGCPIRSSQTEAKKRTYKGPPDECSHCGNSLLKEKEAKSEGVGCIVFVLGIALTPVVVGIPILLYGLHLMSKREGFWRCSHCGAKFPRKVPWHEFA